MFDTIEKIINRQRLADVRHGATDLRVAWTNFFSLVVSCLIAASAAAKDLGNAELFNKAEEAWQFSRERFCDDRTHLFYDRAGSLEPAKRLAELPTLGEIARQHPNKNGWGSGMEDCAMSGGVLLSMLCDRFDATGDQSLRDPAQKAFAGLKLLGTIGKTDGFVARGASPADGRSHYCETSRDQYTWYVYGLWRYYHSPLAGQAEKDSMRKILAAICSRMERNVVAKNNYHLGRDDGTFDGLVDKMWNVEAHEVARLPMIYAIGADLTGDRHWLQLAAQYSSEAAKQSTGDSTKVPYALLQHQISLETLYQLETSPELKRQWLAAMRVVAERAARFLTACRGYRPPEANGVNLDWHGWTMHQAMGGYLSPQAPAAVVAEDRAVRQPAEAALAMLLCPGQTWTPEQLALLKQTIGQVDASKSAMNGIYYTQAIYWRAVRLGVLQLPDKPKN
jgi:hypothetical protein